MSVIIIGEEKRFQSEILEKKDGSLFVVYFFAQWCGPCKMFAGIYESVARENSEIKMCKIDIDVLCNVAANYGIMSIPTIILFKNGQEIERKIGIPDDLSNWIVSNK